jgi:hypothetical protein
MDLVQISVATRGGDPKDGEVVDHGAVGIRGGAGRRETDRGGARSEQGRARAELCRRSRPRSEVGAVQVSPPSRNRWIW